MRLVLATSGFANPGGSEMYVLVVAEQLERLGHDVWIRAVEHGAMAEEAARRGVRVGEPADAPDAVLVQDAPSAYELAEQWPGVPQVFRGCTDVHDFQHPPHLPGVVACVVALSERVASRVRALATPHRLVRLTHPVDVRRFVPLAPIAERPRRALLLGNYLRGERLDGFVRAWEEAGVECRRVGWPAPTVQAEVAINEADIVVGKGRVILEAMACGRAAYVFDFAGCDGWVTPESYGALEADNFAGLATGRGLDDLAGDLQAYDPRMGEANRDLAVRHHHAARHAEALVGLFREVADGPPGAVPEADELARLHRRQWASEGDALTLRGAFEALEQRYEQRRLELEALYADRDVVRAERDAARAEAERLRAARSAPLARAVRRVRGRT